VNTNKEPTLPEERETLITVIKAREEMLDRPDRYAALLSRCRTSAAQTLIRQVFGELAAWQRESGKRRRKFRAKSGQTYHDAIERFIGDLLRAKADHNTSGRIYHALGRDDFDES
jgi:hypothetical protein